MCIHLGACLAVCLTGRMSLCMHAHVQARLAGCPHPPMLPDTNCMHVCMMASGCMCLRYHAYMYDCMHIWLPACMPVYAWVLAWVPYCLPVCYPVCTHAYDYAYRYACIAIKSRGCINVCGPVLWYWLCMCVRMYTSMCTCACMGVCVHTLTCRCVTPLSRACNSNGCA